MLRRPIIEKKYIRDSREIIYYGHEEESPVIIESLDRPLLDKNGNSMTNRGHQYQLLDDAGPETPQSEEVEVVGWIGRTLDCPFDFILHDSGTVKYYLANLKGRTDGWPLFAIQKDQPTCARSGMGSQWNCRLCAKYFGEVCKGR